MLDIVGKKNVCSARNGKTLSVLVLLNLLAGYLRNRSKKHGAMWIYKELLDYSFLPKLFIKPEQANEKNCIDHWSRKK